MAPQSRSSECVFAGRKNRCHIQLRRRRHRHHHRRRFCRRRHLCDVCTVIDGLFDFRAFLISVLFEPLLARNKSLRPHSIRIFFCGPLSTYLMFTFFVGIVFIFRRRCLCAAKRCSNNRSGAFVCLGSMCKCACARLCVPERWQCSRWHCVNDHVSIISYTALHFPSRDTLYSHHSHWNHATSRWGICIHMHETYTNPYSSALNNKVLIFSWICLDKHGFSVW